MKTIKEILLNKYFYLALAVISVAINFKIANAVNPGWIINGENIYNSGNVGIGTTSPAQMLSVSSLSGNSAYFEGNVGIGTAAPVSLFEVSGGKVTLKNNHSTSYTTTGLGWNTDSKDGLAIRNYDSSAKYSSLYFSNDDAGVGSARITLVQQGATDADLAFSLRNPADSSYQYERMRITSDGNVGVGTSTPAQKLDVNGNIKLNGNIVSDGDICIGKCD